MNLQNRRLWIGLGRGILVLATAGIAGYGHDAITTKVTFDREVIRLVVAHCGSCHRDGGSAFSLMSYDAARPWAKDIGEEVLQRQMPPWGAVKGFGDFRNDKALTEEQLELIVDWEEGGAPEGEPKDIPQNIKFPEDPPFHEPANEVMISGDTKLAKDLALDGLYPKKISKKANFQVFAELPDGSIEPLVWIDDFVKDAAQDYKKQFEHPYLLRKPLSLPAGTVIRGVPATDTVALIPGDAAKAERLTGQLRPSASPAK